MVTGNKNVNKFIGILAVILLAVFVGNYLFTVVGSTTEKVMNTNPVELRLHPTVFQDYCFLRTCAVPTNYAYRCSRNEGTAGDFGAGCPTVYFTGAERKLIGSFCTEQPILQIYSVQANIHAEDYFGRRTYPDFAIGTTDNLEKSNEDTELLYASPFHADTNYPTRDIAMNTAKLTSAVKGKSCFNLYAVGGGYDDNIPYGMDITLNHLTVNYDPIECDPTATVSEIQTACDDSDVMTKDICYNYECQNVPVEIIEPPTPPSTGFALIIANLWDWLSQIFASLISFTITGASEVTPGTSETYQIHLTAPVPDSDYSDGTFSTQYGYWAMVDKDGNIIDGETAGVEVDGVYSVTAIVTIPENVNNHVIMATITQIDSTYDFPTSTWIHGTEYVVTKEAISLSTKLPIPTPPLAGGLSGVLTAIWTWITGLFSWLW